MRTIGNWPLQVRNASLPGVNKFLIGLSALLLVCDPLRSATNHLQKSATPGSPPAGTNDLAEEEYEKLTEEDDKAQAEVDQWIRDNNEFTAKGAGVPAADLNRRIKERFEPVRNAYEDFLKRHPDHVKAHLAFGSFLGDMHDEEGARIHWQKAIELDPKNPAAYNNMADLFTHDGSITNAFAYYEKAIQLNPKESLYYHNLGTVVYLFRKDAMQYYGIAEQRVFDKALELDSKALKLDPTNFPLATETAQTYYGVKPLRVEDALKAWTNTLSIAHDEIEREGVYLHLARIKLAAGRFAEARAHVKTVTNEMYTELKGRLVRNLEKQEAEAKGTNAAPATVPGTNAAAPADKLKP